MSSRLRSIRRAESGQTLVIAIIVMGILLVLGLVFTGIVSRNINQSGTARNRAVAHDLSEAGIRYAQSQLRYSRLGADWRGELIDLAIVGVDVTRDPDMLYLRPGTGFGLRSDTDTVLDLGGPDGLGPYTRVTFDNGRALVRVRYAPSDPNIFETAFNSRAAGQLRNPGAARHFLIIESFGRNGQVNSNDPTTLLTSAPIQFRNYANSTAFRTALGEMQDNDKKLTRTRKLIGFATIGLTDQAIFITNRDKVTRPADFGIPEALGAQMDGNAVRVPMVLGRQSLVPNGSNPAVLRPWGGSLRSNAALTIHGEVDAFLNTSLGDAWQVADNIKMDTGSPNNFLGLSYYDLATNSNLTQSTQPDSRSGIFDTVKGLVRDGVDGSDAAGWWRNVGIIEGPAITENDPQTGRNRYLLLTQTSGKIRLRGNDGRFGHGQGVFVNNSQDRQSAADEDQREGLGSEGSLVYDWFNPNNGQRNSGWKGSYYIPRGAFVQLNPDGFTITRDVAATRDQRTWRTPDGADTGSAFIRYRLGQGTDGQLHIVDTYTPGVAINGPITAAQYMNGQPFNGTLYFEANVRVRGVIPTDVQLTLVSGGTIYIEGSITKGVVDPVSGARLNRPSGSMLMLMARDYVAVNTTMFFGPTNGQNLDANGQSVRMAVGGDTLSLQSDFLLNPDTAPLTTNPSLWAPFNTSYTEFGTGTTLSSDLLVSHTMDNGVGQYAMIGLDVNPGVGNSPYLFSLLASGPNPQTNSVFNIAPYLTGYTTPGYGFANFVPIYGLGRESWQRFSKFETMSFPLASNTMATAFPALNNTTAEGLYSLLLEQPNELKFRHQPVGSEPANDYVLKRAAVTPHDIRIEASVYAEQGSFVVIPGYWFNENPNDRRDVFEANVQSNLTALGTGDTAEATRLAQMDRLRDYGSSPKTPFYGEPLDVRLQLIGSISQNMPLPASFQAEWLKKWGWIPRQIGGWYRFAGQNATPVLIPTAHVPAGWDIALGNVNAHHYVPNLITTYDPVLATGRADGFGSVGNAYIRVDSFGRPLAPLPRLPVSPTLAYFGEVIN